MALAVLCAACGGGPDVAEPVPAVGTASAAPALPAVPGIEAEVVRQRTDVAVDGQVHVRVTATGEAPFTVTAVAIDSPGFAPLPPTDVTAAFDPGRTIALRTAYGEPDCAVPPAAAAVLLTVVRPDGTVDEPRVPLAGDDLAVVHREACAVAGVLAVARIELTRLAATGESVAGAVVLTRAGSDDRGVAVLAARRSAVLDVAVAGLPLALEPGDERVAADVEFSSASCEPHVLAETKQPFVFPLSVAVGNAEPVAVPLPVDAAQQALLWELLDRVC